MAKAPERYPGSENDRSPSGDVSGPVIIVLLLGALMAAVVYNIGHVAGDTDAREQIASEAWDDLHACMFASSTSAGPFVERCAEEKYHYQIVREGVE